MSGNATVSRAFLPRNRPKRGGKVRPTGQVGPAWRDESGFAAMWTATIAVAILAFAGVVIDAGYALDARRGADRVAEQAARLAADQIDTDTLYAGEDVTVDADAARSAVMDYLAEAGVSGRLQVSGDTVTVTVTDYQRSSILGAVGIEGFEVQGSATAQTFDQQPVVRP